MNAEHEFCRRHLTIKTIISYRSGKSEPPVRKDGFGNVPNVPQGNRAIFPPDSYKDRRREYGERDRRSESPAKDRKAPSRLFSRYRMYKYTYGTKWIP